MKTEIICILDRSGSMGAIDDDVRGGFERFIKEQKEQPGEARITLVQFDDRYENNYQGRNLAEHAEKLNYMPRGSTALYDAVGRTLNEQGKRIAEEKWAELVIVNIITDGHENASREYTQARVAEMVKHAEANGWKFLFLAANMDAKAAARSIGSSAQFSGNFAHNSVGTQSAYSMSSATSSALRGGQDVQSLVTAGPDDAALSVKIPQQKSHA